MHKRVFTLRIQTPVPLNTGRTGIKKLTAAKVFQKFIYVLSIHIDMAVKVTVAGICIGAGKKKGAPSEISQECIYIYSVNIAVAVKITFAITGISDAVTIRRICIFLVSTTKATASTFSIDHTGSTDCTAGTGAQIWAVRCFKAVVLKIRNTISI